MRAAPGDIAVVRTAGFAAFMVRLGAWLRRRSHQQDHVVIVIDDSQATVEAWPNGGVVLASLHDYSDSKSLTNFDQPKTLEQRQAVVDVAKSLLRHGYDWVSIARDAANCFNLDGKSKPWARGDEPSRFVCSSLADYVYFKVGLPSPNQGAECTPADWTEFIEKRSWDHA